MIKLSLAFWGAAFVFKIVYDTLWTKVAFEFSW